MYQTSEVSRKLGEISKVMADGYYFVHMREMVEEWQDQADNGNKTAQDMMNVIDTFHRLCLAVEGNKSSLKQDKI
jgi:hypothetical protein